MILSRNMLKRVGESEHPCWTPAVVWNQSPGLLMKRTALVALSCKFLPNPVEGLLLDLLRHGRDLAGAGDISHRELVG